MRDFLGRHYTFMRDFSGVENKKSALQRVSAMHFLLFKQSNYLRMSRLSFIAQKFGPHIVQYSPSVWRPSLK